MNVETGRQNIIILFWKERDHAASFMGIHKSEPAIYIGFSPALHLQCTFIFSHLNQLNKYFSVFLLIFSCTGSKLGRKHCGSPPTVGHCRTGEIRKYDKGLLQVFLCSKFYFICIFL
jgi:hypothetical protein